MSNRTNQVACYVNESELLQLKREAAELGVTLSRYVKERLLGDAASKPLPQVDNASTEMFVIEESLNTLEQRICDRYATIAERKTDEVLSRLTLLAAMLDQLALTLLIHTPEIPVDRREAAGTSGERRHRNWQRVVGEALRDLRTNNSLDPINLSFATESGDSAS